MFQERVLAINSVNSYKTLAFIQQIFIQCLLCKALWSLNVFHYNGNASLTVQLIKNPLAMQETPVQFLGGEDPLEKG